MTYTNNISSTYVPNEYTAYAKALFIGESPGEDEEKFLRPFVGPSGHLLRDTIVRNGVSDKEFSFGNLCNYRPLHNIYNYLRNARQLQEGNKELENYIRTNPPNVIIPLGNEALQFVTGGKRTKAATWRGSIIESRFRREDGTIIKCIPTYHPARVIREQTLIPTFDLDIKRILNDSKFPDFQYTPREYVINPTGIALESAAERLLLGAHSLAVDIESSKKDSRIICVGFANSGNYAVTIFPDNAHSITIINKLLSSDLPKIFHFGFYDYCMLRHYGYTVNNYAFDTYIAQHTLNAGQPNFLYHLTSIYTREPYYKSEGRAELPNDTKVWAEKSDKIAVGTYNCKDCCVTFEIAEEQRKELGDEELDKIFEQEMSFIPWMTHMSEAGMLVDMERRELFQKALLVRWKIMNDALDFLCRTPVNVQSPKLKDILYKDLGLPERKHRDKNGKWVVTTDEDALVATVAWVRGKMNEVKTEAAKKRWEKLLIIVQTIIQIRGIRKMLSSYINPRVSIDNRLRSLFKIGPETGRLAANKFVDKTGLNAQTYPRDPIEIPDNLDMDILEQVSLMKADIDEEQDEIFEAA